MKVAVVGAGAAGTAAAWLARRGGADVVVLAARAGATALGSGALDLAPWGESEGTAALLPEEISFAASLGVWSLGTQPRRVATAAGLARPARGADEALLDLELLRGRRVAVADAPVAGWSAEALARGLSASAWAMATGTRFEPRPVRLLVSDREARLPAYELACRHDESGRIERLADALREADDAAEGWLLGPWLGVETDAADTLRRLIGKPCGEITSPPGGPAGARFERAAALLIEEAGIERLAAQVTRVQRTGKGFRIHFRAVAASERADEATLDADAVILAAGGIAAGGLILSDLPRGGARFSPSFEAPVLLELNGQVLDFPASLHGVDIQGSGLAVLERIGIAGDGVRARGCEGLYVAGDIMAGRHRTVLAAVRTGIRAAQAALAQR